MNETIVIHAQSGETLYGIAAQYGVSVDALQRWNEIDNPDLVTVGQPIIVYSTREAPDSFTSESAVLLPAPVPNVISNSWDLWVCNAIVLALFLTLLRRKRGAATPVSGGPSRKPRHGTIRERCTTHARSTVVAKPVPTPQVNAGEQLVDLELMRHYRDWLLINDVLLPSGLGTTQIDHILVSPSVVFVIETKELNGWTFGRPGQQQWTQSFAAGRWSRQLGITSKRFKFYNPLLQNEGHADALVRLGLVDKWRLRPIVVFVGNAQLKTPENFLPFDEHEKIARRNSTWRMRGVICMSVWDLHRYIGFSVSASARPDWTRQQMQVTCAKIQEASIPMTAEAQARHVDYVRSVKQMKSR